MISPRSSCFILEVLLLQSFNQVLKSQREIEGDMQDQGQDKLFNCLFEEAINDGLQCVVW